MVITCITQYRQSCKISTIGLSPVLIDELPNHYEYCTMKMNVLSLLQRNEWFRHLIVNQEHKSREFYQKEQELDTSVLSKCITQEHLEMCFFQLISCRTMGLNQYHKTNMNLNTKQLWDEFIQPFTAALERI